MVEAAVWILVRSEQHETLLLHGIAPLAQRLARTGFIACEDQVRHQLGKVVRELQRQHALLHSFCLEQVAVCQSRGQQRHHLLQCTAAAVLDRCENTKPKLAYGLRFECAKRGPLMVGCTNEGIVAALLKRLRCQGGQSTRLPAVLGVIRNVHI